MDWIAANHNITGGNLVFVGCSLIAAYYAIVLISRHVRERTIWQKTIAVIQEDPLRMAGGFLLLCLGLATRIGGWLPWRAMREAENWPLANWYADQSWIWTNLAAFLTVAGMSFILWPALSDRLGKWAWVAVISIPAGLYTVGVLATELLVPVFRP